MSVPLVRVAPPPAPARRIASDRVPLCQTHLPSALRSAPPAVYQRNRTRQHSALISRSRYTLLSTPPLPLPCYPDLLRLSCHNPIQHPRSLPAASYWPRHRLAQTGPDTQTPRHTPPVSSRAAADHPDTLPESEASGVRACRRRRVFGCTVLLEVGSVRGSRWSSRSSWSSWPGDDSGNRCSWYRRPAASQPVGQSRRKLSARRRSAPVGRQPRRRVWGAGVTSQAVS